MGVFFATAVVCVLLIIVALWRWREVSSLWLVGGALLYLIGTILVTLARNGPRNQALARVAGSNAEAAALWARYLKSWTAWNDVRTVAALPATALFAYALR